MKKLVLPLLLLLGISMLLAQAVSEPSEVVGYVKYDCVVGDNFVAMPMVQSLAWTSEFGAQFGDDINTIYIWNPATQTWDFSVNYGEGFWDPEMEIGTNSTLFFNTANPITFYSIGDLPATPAQFSVVVGDNTAMIPLNRSDLNSTALTGSSMGDGETVNTIYVWNSATQTWDFSVNYGEGFWDPEMEMSIGMPMFFNSGSEFTWPAPAGRATFQNNLNNK